MGSNICVLPSKISSVTESSSEDFLWVATSDLVYSECAKGILPVRGISELQIVRLIRQLMNGEIFHQTKFSLRYAVI